MLGWCTKLMGGSQCPLLARDSAAGSFCTCYIQSDSDPGSDPWRECPQLTKAPQNRALFFASIGHMHPAQEFSLAAFWPPQSRRNFCAILCKQQSTRQRIGGKQKGSSQHSVHSETRCLHMHERAYIHITLRKHLGQDVFLGADSPK